MTVDLCPPVDPTIDVIITYPTDGDDATFLIPPDCAGDIVEDSVWWWNALSWPFFDYRYDYAPPSAWLPGQVLLSAVPGPATIPLGIVIRSATSLGAPGLADLRAMVEQQFRQPDSRLAFDVDGDGVGEWQCDPAIVNWGPVSVLTLGMFAQEGAVVIPVNPVEAT